MNIQYIIHPQTICKLYTEKKPTYLLGSCQKSWEKKESVYLSHNEEGPIYTQLQRTQKRKEKQRGNNTTH